MTSIYVSGASRDHERVAYWVDIIRRNQLLTLTSTWHKTAAQWAGQDARLPVEDQRNVARVDLSAVHRADVVWLLMPPSAGSAGAFVELGYALAHQKRVYVSGTNCSASIFTSLARVRDTDDRVVYHEICRYAESLRHQSVRPSEALQSERPYPHG